MEKADPEVVNKACNQVDSVLNARIPLLMRIKYPLVWARLPGGIRVQDLHEDRYHEAMEHIKNVYMVDEVLCKSINLTGDPDSVENFSKLILSRMSDTQSLIAVKEDENRIIGCLIERVIDNLFMKTMSRMSIYEGENLCKIQRLRKHILKNINLQEICGTHRCNDIYIWSVEAQYRNRGIGKALLEAAIRQTRLFKACALCGIFTSDISQTIVKNAGFQTIYDVQYSSWVEGVEMVFENPGENNYSANFMVLVYEDIVELLANEGKTKNQENDGQESDLDKLKDLEDNDEDADKKKDKAKGKDESGKNKNDNSKKKKEK